MSETAKAEGSVVVTHAVGLHARPSVKLTKLAKSFRSTIQVRGAGLDNWVDAKSIVRVMGLKLPQGTRIELKADGPDAEAAVAALVALVERDFVEPQAD
jgi:phosphocarrier protein HPr